MDRIGPLRRSVAAALVAFAVLVAALGDAVAADFAHVRESRFDELLRLPQWRRVSHQLPAQAAAVRACLEGDCKSAAAMRLAEFVVNGRTAERMTQLKRVQKAVNRQRYLEDRDQFAREDLWQTPLAFVDRGGDCEDFAIAKYFVLKLLGFSIADLRIAVLTGTERNEVHAVLLVRVQGQWHVLDNRYDEPTSLARYREWTPQYALNETAGFRYSSATEARSNRVGAPAGR